MNTTPSRSSTRAVREAGQSIWLDYIRRSLIDSRDLQRLIREDQLRGLTSNPSIFQKAIGGSDEYDEAIAHILEKDPDCEVQTLFERLAVEDIRRAADEFRPVHEETGYDGMVSFEVSPHLARDTEGTVEEARRLWAAVDRPNLMIKVPATPAGIPAIEQLISEGINVNVTLMFSLDHYENVAEAYVRGLERADDPTGIVSVASFFVSRVSRRIDAKLEDLDQPVPFHGGDAAIANARMAYRRFEEIFHGDRFAGLRDAGAFVQRPLWASTSTKNPAYSDVLYVEELIGPDTVNTLPPHTLHAFRDHGEVRGATVTEDLDRAREILDRLPELGIDLDRVTRNLQDEGVDKFADSFDGLMDVLREKRTQLRENGREQISFALDGYRSRVDRRLEAWEEDHVAARIWRHDATVWAEEDTPEIRDRLGWLRLPETMQEEAARIASFAETVRSEFDDAVVLGMGGSSLAPDVFTKVNDFFSGVFGADETYPRLTVLDSTHPEAVLDLENEIELERTLFIVASKSGTTAETMSFFRYFWNRLDEAVEEAGDHFVATTDPGSPLTELAEERGFRDLFLAPADVGGRYSALTPFGLVPAALIGIDVGQLLEAAWTASEGSAFCVDATRNSGLELGAVLGELALAGRDKITFAASSSFEAFPAWLEQLIAESTGKDDTGIVPVAGESLTDPDRYGDDRVFVYFGLRDDEDRQQKERLTALESAGHPVIRTTMEREVDLAREMYRWEMGVAAAGAVLGIHPFNQPNVEAAKKLARRAMEDDGAAGNGSVPTVPTSDARRLVDELYDWLDDAAPGGYVAVQAYLPPRDDTTDRLRELVVALRDRTGLATTLGYGPRFLHSTGQLHKGGPGGGLFLQIVDAPDRDVAVPETDYTFGELIRAQAIGDYRALAERDRNLLRVRASASEIPPIIAAVRNSG